MWYSRGLTVRLLRAWTALRRITSPMLLVGTLALMLTLLLQTSTRTSSAQPVDCVQPERDGCLLPLGLPVWAVLDDEAEPHIWIIEVDEPGSLTISLTDLPADFDLHVYAFNGVEIGKSTNKDFDDDVVSLELEPGIYYAFVGSWSGEISDDPYILTATFTRAATPTPVPPPAPPASPFPYVQTALAWEANCSRTEVKLFVRDNEGRAVNGVRFQIAGGDFTAASFPTGQSGYGPGFTDFFLRHEPIEVTWRIWVIDDYSNRLSEEFRFQTRTENCGPGTGGHQIATITWTRTR